jgi:tubulin alpha
LDSGRFHPRSIFLDLDPEAMDEIRVGPLRKLYDPNLLLNHKSDGANVYARGKYTIGKELIDLALDRIRGMTDQCTGL